MFFSLNFIDIVALVTKTGFFIIQVDFVWFLVVLIDKYPRNGKVFCGQNAIFHEGTTLDISGKKSFILF